eukprot:g3266.t1
MGKKGGGKKKAAAVDENAQDMEGFITNYKKACKAYGVKANDDLIKKLLNEEEGEKVGSALNIALELGPAGTRALCAGIMGRGAEMKGGPFKQFTCLRFWRSDARPEGVWGVAELLRLGGEDIKLVEVEFCDNKIGPRGCANLGESLSHGCNNTLTVLKLDYDNTIGDEGCAALCRGLRSNGALKSLSLQYDDIGAEGGKALADMLAFKSSGLETLKLRGNRIGESVETLAIEDSSAASGGGGGGTAAAAAGGDGDEEGKGGEVVGESKGAAGDDIAGGAAGGDGGAAGGSSSAAAAAGGSGGGGGRPGWVRKAAGLKALSESLCLSNRKLTSLDLSDNKIDADDEDALRALRDMLLANPVCTTIDLEWNYIAARGAEILMPGLDKEANKHTSVFKVDTSIPKDLFEKISRNGKSGGKKGKKGKKKGKKKKK